MPDDGNSLKLIQRAAKRLAPVGGDAAQEFSVPPPAPPPHTPLPTETAPRVNLSAEASPTVDVRPAKQEPRISIPAESASASRQVRLRLSEMRMNGMITPDNLTSPIAQEYRAIKRKLLSTARNEKTRVIENNLVMVTSALPREGKTFTSINLAISLAAERDLHVLLIDGDVVRPSASTLFEPQAQHGLVELLNGQCRDMSEVIYRCSDVPNLSIVFAGKPDVKTPELVSSRRMAEICKDVSSRYSDRIIIIDTPPVLASAEPAAMAAFVHQIIMVVASGHANRVQIQSAIEHISVCRNVSLLFNKAPAWSRPQTDSYHYYSYYRRGADGADRDSSAS